MTLTAWQHNIKLQKVLPCKAKTLTGGGLEKGEQIKLQKSRKSVTFLADYGMQLNYFICVKETYYTYFGCWKKGPKSGPCCAADNRCSSLNLFHTENHEHYPHLIVSPLLKLAAWYLILKTWWASSLFIYIQQLIIRLVKTSAAGFRDCNSAE